MKKSELKKFQTMFEEEKKKLLVATQFKSDEFNPDEGDPSDDADYASGDLERNMRVQLKNRGVQHLVRVEEALKRIRAGDYGVCISCEESIETKRLIARPTAMTCLSCTEDRERRERGMAPSRSLRSNGFPLEVH
jgi:DnaK suppressor protein